MQSYDITILIFGLSERDGLILNQCVRGGSKGGGRILIQTESVYIMSDMKMKQDLVIIFYCVCQHHQEGLTTLCAK